MRSDYPTRHTVRMEFEVHTGEPGTIGSTDRYKSEDARYEILSGGVLLIVEGTQKTYYAPTQWTEIHDPAKPRRY